MIEERAKGCKIDPPDPRDYLITEQALGASQVVWKPDYTPSTLTFWDQGQSLSCVAASTSEYGEKVDGGVYSKRDLYSRIFFPGGGAYIRDGILQRIKGQALEKDVPDPLPPTEAEMRTTSPATRQIPDQDGFLIADHTIDGIAAAIDRYNGVVFGLNGTNQGWVDELNPRPPASGEAQWGHALFAEQYHLHNGVKCILAVSSWIPQAGTNHPDYHHIKEDYFVSGNTFNPWTLIPKGTNMNQYVETMNYNGTIGVFVPVSDPSQLPVLNNLFNVNLTQGADGTIVTQKTVKDA